MKNLIILPPFIETLGGIFNKYGYDLYAVGGFVRNSLLRLPLTDIDVCSMALPNEVMRILKNEGINVKEKALNFGTVEIHMDFEGAKHIIEHTTFRRDYYSSGGRHRPDKVIFTADIYSDAIRRDFTINALYADTKTCRVSDITGRGLADLKNRIVSAANDDPYLTIKDDGLRLMRMVRFSCELGFNIDPLLYAAAKKNICLLNDISAERINAELVKILLSDVKYPSMTNEELPHKKGLLLLYDLGAFRFMLTSLLKCVSVRQNKKYHDSDVFMHSINACAFSKPYIIGRLSALLHDTGKPFSVNEQGKMYGHEDISMRIAEEELKRLRFDNRTIGAVLKLIKNHMFDLENKAKPNAVRKKIIGLGVELFRMLIDLRRADFYGSAASVKCESADKWQNILDRMTSENAPFCESDLLISGYDIMKALGLGESETIGVIKRRLLNICALYPSKNNKGDLLAEAKKIYGEIRSRRTN